MIKNKDELMNYLQVLWAYKIVAKVATEKTPYSLAFGFKVVIPVEIEASLFRVKHFNELRNEELM